MIPRREKSKNKAYEVHVTMLTSKRIRRVISFSIFFKIE